MGFRLLPKSVTLNDLERRISHYFALFRGIRQFGSFRGQLRRCGLLAVDLLLPINVINYTN